MTALVDTGIPISLLPKKWAKKLGLKNKQEAPRGFVDLNNNTIRIDGIYEADTKLFGTTQKVQWWSMKTTSPPILGLNNFEKLGLKLVSKVPSAIRNVEEQDGQESERIRALERKLYG